MAHQITKSTTIIRITGIFYSPIGKRSAYFDNYYGAKGTNSIHDVRINDENDVITDLKNIGYVNVTTEVRKSYSDSGHSHWIYIKAFKP